MRLHEERTKKKSYLSISTTSTASGSQERSDSEEQCDEFSAAFTSLLAGALFYGRIRSTSSLRSSRALLRSSFTQSPPLTRSPLLATLVADAREEEVGEAAAVEDDVPSSPPGREQLRGEQRGPAPAPLGVQRRHSPSSHRPESRRGRRGGERQQALQRLARRWDREGQ